MQVSVETFTVQKRFPLTISRGTSSESTNIWVRVEEDGIEGWGEASPFTIPISSYDTLTAADENVFPAVKTEVHQSTGVLFEAFEVIMPMLEIFSPWERQQIEWVLADAQMPSAVWAAIDMALYDWLGKQVGLPLWRLWGLNRRRIVPISVTVGINSPEGARQRVRDWLPVTGGGVLKVKLGSPAGIEADQAMLLGVRSEAPQAVLTVDANGGWSLKQALQMCNWLAEFGVKYVEQPLAAGYEADLPWLYERSPLPIFVDESCLNARDIPRLADRVHGINIKLMKSGGLTEAWRMVHTARACGLQIMFGCYSDSTLANTAASQLSPVADYLDLDSHLNLINDPFRGAMIQDGRLIPNNLPGLGVHYDASHQ